MPFDGDARWQMDILAADKTASAFASVDRRIKGLESNVAAMGRSMAAGVGQTVALGRGLHQLAVAYGVLAAGQKALQAGFKIGDLGEQAEQIGITTDQLQAYRLMAAQAGVTNEQLDASVMKLARSMGTANDGNDEMIARFQKLGVNLLDSDKKLRPVADILPEVAQGMLKVSSDTERSALMAELFGRSGARLKTMLEEWAKGNDRLVSSAKAQNAIAGPDAIKAWDKLGDQLLVGQQRFETLIATMGKPVALLGLQAINTQLALMNSTIKGVQKAYDWLTSRAGSGVSLADMQKEAGEVQGRIDRLHLQPPTTSNQALMQREYARMGVLQQQIADKMTADAVVTLPPIAVGGNTSNPTGRGAGAAAAKLDDRLRDLQVERAALEKALAAFEIRGNESVEDVDRRLDAQAKLDKKIHDSLKDVPPNSPLAAQLTQEATAIATYTQRLDEKKRLLTEAEGITQRYGDGTRVLAREVAQLDKLLAANAITQGTYNAALKATTQAADDQARAYRAAAGGADAFIAGIEQAMADLDRANSTFELGKRIVDDTSQAIGDLASGAEVDFNRILAGWITMWAQMEMRAAASSLWTMLGGKSEGGGGGGGLAGLLISGISSLFGSFSGGGGWEIGPVGGAYNGGGSMSYGGPRAAGGRVSPGNWYMVGERGPEPFIPDSAGTILPADSLGGSTTVIVNQTVHIGEYVTGTEYRKGLAAVKKAAEDGAYARVVDDRRRGGSLKKVFG